MDVGDEEGYGVEKRNAAAAAAGGGEWRFPAIGVPGGRGGGDHFLSTIWTHHAASGGGGAAAAGYGDHPDACNAIVGKPVTDFPWNPRGAFHHAGPPPPPPAADSTFIERAAWFSCFGGSPAIDHFADAGSPVKTNKDEDSDEDGREDSSSKKRKHAADQEMEIDQEERAPAPAPASSADKENGETGQKGKPNTSVVASGKPTGKNAKNSTEAPKEDYIHVRARRGQATNSHSLAERVRREKISERMKFLQDLVPGCSKVTGKAVMLDEIINYVQSLQRQVEFLSMKLAAVNPRLDFNAEGMLSRDILHTRGCPSSTVSFLPDVIHQQVHPSHQGLLHAGMSGILSPSDGLRRLRQLNSINGYKEPAHQNAWDNELNNVIQLTYGANPSLGVQDLNGKPQDGFPL